MRVAELRIGNWVYNSTTKNKMQVYPMMIPQLYTIEKENGSLGDSNIKPIPLTEEILLKCGFVKDDFSKTYVRYSIGNFNIIHDTDKDIFICDGIKYTLVCVEYLHQLQNLYYVLTGEELEVSL